MSTPEHPDTPALTRKQIRELRHTGSNPVIAPAEAPIQPAPPAPPVVAPLPRAAAPVVVPEPPVADSAVDLGVSPLTRRQARQQERIRTASVPVITPEVIAAHAAATGAPPAPALPQAPLFAPTAAPQNDADELRNLFGAPQSAAVPASPSTSDDPFAGLFAAPVAPARPPIPSSPAFAPVEPVSAPVITPTPEAAAPEVEPDRAIVSPTLGAALIAEPAAVESDLAPSFDQLLSRPTTGGIALSSTLIVATSTGDAPIVAPVAATGEMLVTGTFNLPEGLGSTGFASGSADGKEVDAVLVDGELPAHSSPTPIAASAAVSTVKTAGEVIKPPAPEQGSKLMISLAITAGVLALALVGVLILAFTTGVL